MEKFKMDPDILIAIPSNTEDLDFIDLENGQFLEGGLPNLDITKYLTGVSSEEETLDVADLKHNLQIPMGPISPCGPPERKIDVDTCNFEIEIDGSLTQKKKFLYSHLLNRIYVEMGSNFSVNFKWDVNRVRGQPMYIRATVVFADSDQAEKRVERCLQHAHVSSNGQITKPVVVNNVLRSARDLADPNVYYCGDPSVTDCWYSVVVQLSGPTGHAYHFVCKNSCSSGINRRSIDIIFTLEDSFGNVYGRQIVGARVCSCTRRDKNQQEEEFRALEGKRPLPQKGTKAKKIKLEVVSNDNEVVSLPKIEIVGPRAAITALKVAHNMMDQKRAMNQSHQQTDDNLEKCMNNIKKIIDNLESKYNTNVL